MPTTDHRSNGTRRYRSPRRTERARQTRARILTAARKHFLAVGYNATKMRAIASTAGVSVASIELLFGTKPHLLKAVIDVAIAGDDEPVPVLQRSWAVAAQATTTVDDFLAIVGDVLQPAEERSAGLVLVAREAAAVDRETAALSRQIDVQRARTVAWIVDEMIQRSPLRSGIDRDRAIDTVWMLIDPGTFIRLTRDRGWTSEEFVLWLTDAIPRLLLPTPGEDDVTRADDYVREGEGPR